MLLAHLLANFHIGPIQRADGDRAIHGEFHVAGARGLEAGGGDLLGEVGGWVDLLGQFHVEVSQEHHLEQVAAVGVVVDHLSDAVDQANDQLGHGVARCGLAGEHHRAWRHALRAALFDPQVAVHQLQGIEVLALVFVDPLDLDVEQGGGIHQQAVALGHQGAELTLGGQLATAPALQHRVVVLPLLQRRPALGLHRPAAAQQRIQQGRQRRVGEGQPTPGGDAVGDVGELLGPQGRKVGEQIPLHQVAVQGGDTIDAMGPKGRQVGHAHGLGPPLVDQRHPAQHGVIAGVAHPHLLQKTGIELEDDLQVAGQQPPEQVEPPALQGLGQQGVVGVGQRSGGDPPGLVPIQLVLIHQQPHQLGHRNGGVGVVELHGPVLLEIGDRQAALLQIAQHVLQRAAHKEVLLLEPQQPPGIGAVVGIEHLGEGLTPHLLLHRGQVVAAVEGGKIKALGGHGPPEPQPAAGVHPETEHGNIVRDAQHFAGGMPLHPQAALVITVHGGVAAEPHAARLVGIHQLPGPAALEPLIGDLHLGAVLDQLVKDAEFVADAIPRGGQLQAGQRFHEAGGQTPQATVAETRLLLNLQDALQGDPGEAGDGFTGLIDYPEHQQVVGELGADQKLRRQVGHGLGGLTAQKLLVGQMAADQPIPNRIAQGHVEIVVGWGRCAGPLAEKQVLGEPVKEIVGR